MEKRDAFKRFMTFGTYFTSACRKPLHTAKSGNREKKSNRDDSGRLACMSAEVRLVLFAFESFALRFRPSVEVDFDTDICGSAAFDNNCIIPHPISIESVTTHDGT
jgi:hypothetical protein